MSTGGKVALGIVVGFLVLLIVGGGACFYIVSRFGKEFAEDAKRRQEEGQSFGQNADNAACLKEALDRNRKDGSFTSLISVNVFLATCLKESKPTPGFCDGVPSLQDKEATAGWASRKCAETQQSGKGCEALYTVVQSYCDGGLRDRNEPPAAEPSPEKTKELKRRSE
jgi:hypothetical protein